MRYGNTADHSTLNPDTVRALPLAERKQIRGLEDLPQDVWLATFGPGEAEAIFKWVG